jgi:hypothetical protein
MFKRKSAKGRCRFSTQGTLVRSFLARLVDEAQDGRFEQVLTRVNDLSRGEAG